MPETPDFQIEYTADDLARAEAILQEHYRRKSAVDFEVYRRKYEGKFFKCSVNDWPHQTEKRWRYVALQQVTETDRLGFSFETTREGEIVVCPRPGGMASLPFGGELIEIDAAEFWAEADRVLQAVRDRLTSADRSAPSRTDDH